MFERNYKEMLRQMDEPEPNNQTHEIQGEAEDLIKKTVLDETVQNESLIEEYNNQHPRFDFKNQEYEHAMLIDEMKNLEHTSTPLQGRMSPAAK